MVTKWEYTVLEDIGLGRLEEVLDRYGEGCWELVQVIVVSDRLDVTCVFKRPL